MTMKSSNLSGNQEDNRRARIGIAKLTKLAFDGADLGPLWNSLLDEVARDPRNTAAVMDMSVIAQLLGDRDSGLMLQSGALNIERLYRSPCSSPTPRLRVLALAAAIDMGANTPLEFLLEDSDIELLTLYIVPGMPVPDPLPAHDVAFVAVPDSKETQATLAEIDRRIPSWPRPVLNLPQRIAELNRDRLHRLLKSVPGLHMPTTARVSRSRLSGIGQEAASLRESLEDGVFPLIARPVDSHAGRGLAKLDEPSDIEQYLQQRPEPEFFISHYVDYSDADGLFRKYRVVVIDGRPYACHMAISDQWKIWYLNADMAASIAKRAEEERFMSNFDEAFAGRHAIALAEMTKRIGLEYFAIDCAETRAGELLLFEADNAMIVHNMDPPEIFPYKAPQMRRIFQAFAKTMQACAQLPHKRAA